MLRKGLHFGLVLGWDGMLGYGVIVEIGLKVWWCGLVLGLICGSVLELEVMF